MRRIALFAVLIMAGVLVPRAAATPDPRLEERLGETAVHAVTAVLDSATAEGLPVEPLVQKALEGVTKGAPEERIAWAVRALLGRLRLSRLVLGKDADEAELTAAAAAIFAGVDTTALAQLRDAAPPDTAATWIQERSLALELIILADLIERGVPSEMAATMIGELAGRGVADRQLVALRNQVAREISSGAPPLEAATRWIQEYLEGGSAPPPGPSR